MDKFNIKIGEKRFHKRDDAVCKICLMRRVEHNAIQTGLNKVQRFCPNLVDSYFVHLPGAYREKNQFPTDITFSNISDPNRAFAMRKK